MPDDKRRAIIERADRILEQSKLLRKMADELRNEGRDLRRSAKQFAETRSSARDRRKRRIQ